MSNYDYIYLIGYIFVGFLVWLLIIIAKRKEGELNFLSILFYTYVIISLTLGAICCLIDIVNPLLVIVQLLLVSGLIYSKYSSIGYLVLLIGLYLGLDNFGFLPNIIKIICQLSLCTILPFLPEITGYFDRRKMYNLGATEIEATCIDYKYTRHGHRRHGRRGALMLKPIYEFYINEKRYVVSSRFYTFLSMKKYLPEKGTKEIVLVNIKNPKQKYVPYPKQEIELKIVSCIFYIIIIFSIILF